MNLSIAMKHLLLSVLAIAACSLAVGCGGTRAAQATGGDGMVVDSASLRVGIAGEVRQRPTKPVENEDDIPWGPLAGATIWVEDKTNTRIGTVQSDANGKFYLQLEPGTHYLRPQAFPGKMFPHPMPSQRVYVPEGEIVHVIVEYDTGIR
jgi:hypothetical protein